MAYNFPNSPSNGDTVTISNVTYTYNSTSGAWKTTAAGGASGASVTSSDTAPSSPSAGDLWYDTTTLRLYVYYNDGSSSQWVKANPSGSSGALVQETAPSNPGSGNLWFDPSSLETYVYYNDGDSNQWVQTNPSGGSSGTTVYSSINDLPLSGVETGAQAFVSSTSRLYLWNGTGWYNIALINTTPSISGASSSYTLATDGTATTVTITATDPEGIPITYSIASDTSGNIATVAQGSGASSNVFTITPSTNSANVGTFSLTFRASDGVNIATAVSQFTLLFTIENSNYTTALITSVGANNAVNNSFDDASTNNHTITASGNVTQGTFSPYRHGGYSTYFDGSGDYVNVVNDVSISFGTGEFTIECWIYRTSAAGTYQAIISANDASGSGAHTGFFAHSSNNTISLYSSASNLYTTSNTISSNKWHHICATRNSSSVLKIYIDGIEGYSGTVTDNFNTGTNGFNVGQDVSSSNGAFIGYIRDVRLVKGSAIVPSSGGPSEPLTAVTNTSLLTCHLPYIADGSTNSHSITANGNTKTEPFSPYNYSSYSTANNGGSMYFDGTGDYLNAGTNASLALGSGDFTFECWIYPPTATMANYAGIYSNTSDGQGDSNALRFGNLATSSTTLAVQTAASSIFNSTSNAVKVGQWNHVALVRNGTATNNMTIYVNGVASGQGTSTANFSTGYATIGTNVYAGVHYLYSGYIADARVVQGTAVYTSAFTPPTAPLTAITNTSLLLSGTNAGIIDKSQSVQTLTLNGDVKSSTTQTKYLSSSMYFDGTGDYITMPASTDFYFDGEFTWECWVNCGSSYFRQRQRLLTPAVSTSSGAAYISIGNDLGINGGAQSGVFCCTYSVSVNPFLYANVNGTNTGTAVTVPLSQWCHLAITRDSNNDVKMWQDGVLVASGSYSGAFDFNRSVGARVGGSGWSTEDFGGHMSDLRITKGLARYTANFTAPTAALQG